MKVIFVCLGNICRSPMAEYIFKSMTSGLDIISRGISNEEYSNDIYEPAKKVLNDNNIKYGKHFARKISFYEYKSADMIVVMEKYQKEKLISMYGNRNNIITLLDIDIEDPWYTGNFNKVYDQIYDGCIKLKNKIEFYN